MGAPTVSDEDILKETMEEYGLTAAELGRAAETDEDAEQALLARFLFAPPKRTAIGGERNGLVLDRVARQLEALLRMLSGRSFAIAYSDPPATDNVNVYLPRAVPAPEEPSDFLVYRCMGLVQVGFVRYGLLRDRRLLAELYRDWVLRSAWHLLAARWVLRKWAEEYPGLREDIRRVALLDKAGSMRVNVTEVPRDGLPGAFLPLYEGLATCLNWRAPGKEGDPAREAIRRVDTHVGPGIEIVLLGQAQRLREHFRALRLGPPPLPWFVGIVRPEWILADLARDVVAEQEWKKGNKPLRQLMEAMGRKPEGLRGRLLAKLAGPDTSKMPAYGKLRDEHNEQLVDAKKPGEDGTEYDEWDYKAGVYHLAATRVVEVEAATGGLDGWERVVRANQRQIKEIRRRFESLRIDERWISGQPDGPEVDLNRAILAFTDIAAGQQPDDRLYRRFVRQKQTVAILTMVDLSGSTQGHVIHLEQEALVLFAEGLKSLSYPHAFYGFGNLGPRDCSFARIKGFDEAYGDAVHKRLGNLRPEGATRMGAFIRHAGHVLASRPQARRILMIVSDGRPEDRGDYRGTFGVKDTAMAVTEARRLGVHVHCISLDPDGGEYLEEIFGKGRYLKLESVDSLPARLPEVFKGLVR